MVKRTLKSITTGNDLFILSQEMGLNLPEKNIMFMEEFDNLLNSGKLPHGNYILLDQHYDEEGNFCWEHWIAVRYFGKKEKQTVSRTNEDLDGVEFLWFNTFGLPPTENTLKILEKRKIPLSFNAKVIQHVKEGHCGQFCLIALHHIENGTYIKWMKSFKGEYSQAFHDLMKRSK